NDCRQIPDFRRSPMTASIPSPLLLNLSLGGLDAPRALALSDNVTSVMGGNPFFGSISLDPVMAAMARLKESLRATSAGNHTMIPQRDADLACLVKELTRVGFNVQLHAIDDEDQLHRSGFEAVNGKEQGVVYLNAMRQPGAFGYQFQFTDQDATVEANWKDAVTSKGCNNIEVKVPDPLKRYTFRGRPLGNEGPGPWSAHVTISVT